MGNFVNGGLFKILKNSLLLVSASGKTTRKIFVEMKILVDIQPTFFCLKQIFQGILLTRQALICLCSYHLSTIQTLDQTIKYVQS